MGYIESSQFREIASSANFDIAHLPKKLEVGRSYIVDSRTSNQLYLSVLDKSVSVEDTLDDEERYMLAKIVNNSYIEFGLFTRDRSMLVHPDFRASRFFDASIHYFTNLGYSVHGIITNWASGTNYTQYLENLNAGFDKFSAAANTWTGKKAFSHGYTKIEDISGYFGFEKIKFKFYW